jgi:lipopolysaccharide transport system permease protein
MLMMISPIAYTADMVPEPLQPFLAANPLFYIIISFQDSLMIGQFPRGMAFWGLVGLGLIFFWLGYWFFMRMKIMFADNV